MEVTIELYPFPPTITSSTAMQFGFDHVTGRGGRGFQDRVKGVAMVDQCQWMVDA